MEARRASCEVLFSHFSPTSHSPHPGSLQGFCFCQAPVILKMTLMRWELACPVCK